MKYSPSLAGKIVPQTSKSAVSQVSKPAGCTISYDLPIWKSAIQQVWKPAIRFPFAGKPSRFNASTLQRFNAIIFLALTAVSTPLYASEITLQDNQVSVSFDSDSGALTRFEDKSANWVIERRPELGASFRLYAPLPNRRYNPVFGQKQHVAEIKKVSDNEVSMRWENLVSENGGTLPMSLTADVTLAHGQLTFAATLKNDSPLTVETIEYPCLGDLNPRSRDSSLTVYTRQKGHLQPDELYPHFHNEKGYWGVTWPTKMLEPQNSRFCLIQSSDAGLHIGTEGPTDYRVQYVFEQHPGVISGVTALVPPSDEISEIPVHLEFRVCHFIFAGPHSTTTLAPVVLKGYQVIGTADGSSPNSKF